MGRISGTMSGRPPRLNPQSKNPQSAIDLLRHPDLALGRRSPPRETLLLVFASRGYEAGEQRMRDQRFGFEFGMKLAAEKPGVIRQFDDLYEIAVRRIAADFHSVGGERLLVFPVELVAVPVPLGNFLRAVHAGRQRVRLQYARIR